MIKNIGVETTEPHGLLVSDKMYIVTLISKRLSQLCCQNTTSTESWIANDTYIHIEFILNRTLKNTAKKEVFLFKF
jgi:hypothetical protein